MFLLTQKIYICRNSHVVYNLLNMERLIGNFSYINSHLIPVRNGILTEMVRILNGIIQHFQMGIIICYANKDLFKFDCLRCLKVSKMWQKICSGRWGHFPSNQQSFFLAVPSNKDYFHLKGSVVCWGLGFQVTFLQGYQFGNQRALPLRKSS